MEERVYKKYGGTFTIITDRLCRVRHNWCGHEFDFDLNRNNPIVDFLRKNIRCPGCAHSFSIPDEICELMPEIEFSTDENDLQKITCSCRHTFHFELEDIEPGPEFDKIKCPNCGYKIRTSPPYLNKVEFRNPMQYTKLHNYDEFKRYLRVSENLDEELLIDYFKSLSKEQLRNVRIYPYEPTKRHAQLLALFIKVHGVDVITNHPSNFKDFDRYYDKHYKDFITNYDEIYKSHWNKHGKRIIGNEIISEIQRLRYDKGTEEIANMIQNIKDKVNEYGVDIIQPAWTEYTDMDDRMIKFKTTKTVYSFLCSCIVHTNKEIATLLIDFIVWLHSNGFKAKCIIETCEYAAGDHPDEYVYYTYDLSDKLEIILSDPQNAYEILHKQDK